MTMSKMRISGMMLAMTLAMNLSGHAAEVLTNGSFDEYTGGGSGAAGAPAQGDSLNTLTPSSWKSSGPVSWRDHAGPVATPTLSPQGGTGMIGFFDPGSAYIYQTFSTLNGGEYTVNFYVARQTTNGPPSFLVDVYDGASLTGTNITDGGEQTITIDGTAGTWTMVSVTFTAASATSTLSFKENGASSAVDPFLDTVSVVGPAPIPTPAALPAGLTLLAIGAMRRRRV